MYRVGRFGVLYVLVGVGWWLGGSLPGVHVSLGKCKIMLAFFINTVYIIKTSFTTPKGGKQWNGLTEFLPTQLLQQVSLRWF